MKKHCVLLVLSILILCSCHSGKQTTNNTVVQNPAIITPQNGKPVILSAITIKDDRGNTKTLSFQYDDEHNPVQVTCDNGNTGSLNFTDNTIDLYTAGTKDSCQFTLNEKKTFAKWAIIRRDHNIETEYSYNANDNLTLLRWEYIETEGSIRYTRESAGAKLDWENGRLLKAEFMAQGYLQARINNISYQSSPIVQNTCAYRTMLQALRVFEGYETIGLVGLLGKEAKYPLSKFSIEYLDAWGNVTNTISYICSYIFNDDDTIDTETLIIDNENEGQTRLVYTYSYQTIN